MKHRGHRTDCPEGQLSPREAQTLRLARDGYNYDEIAFRMGTSLRRVSNILGDLRNGLRLPTRRDLTIWSLQHPEAFQIDPETGELCWVDLTFHPPGCQCPAPYCAQMALAPPA